MSQSDIRYPLVELDLKKFRNNVGQAVERCGRLGIGLAGVIKGFTGIPEGAKQFAEAGVDFIGSSRLEQIRGCIDYGIKASYMLIRVPMLSEAGEAVGITDISLQSEVEVLKAFNREALKQGKVHKVVLMIDLGDLREGFWDKKELLDAALMVENECDGLYLAGVGTNLGCYGSIKPTPEKMNDLIADAEMIEQAIGRKLDIISGGATTSFPLVLDNTMPERINNLRIGEGIILAKDLKDLYNLDMSFMYQDAFTLKAQVIEVKDKPSYPVGELSFDAFGNIGTYVDKGIRKKALLGLGKVDVAYPDMIFPRDKGIEILGASSDHMILDITEAEKDYKVGDIVEFDLCYATVCFVTNSPNVRIVCK
ncbi:MAG TPA: alanine/ornithine racemase family PLP-dependent enzyme [Anaerovoracaceae bacterium]|nr:alanine/ornithine racemase family PLP-dependent enzyme [Anaerovoracaceae bacterium]